MRFQLKMIRIQINYLCPNISTIFLYDGTSYLDEFVFLVFFLERFISLNVRLTQKNKKINGFSDNLIGFCGNRLSRR